MTDALSNVDTRTEGLRTALDKIDQAARREGIEESAPLGLFILAQRNMILELGNVAAGIEEAAAVKVGQMQVVIEGAERRSENELLKLNRLMEGAYKVLELAKHATQVSHDAQVNTREQAKKTIAMVAQEMATQLLDQTEGWLLIKQKAINRRESWILSGIVFFIAFSLLLSGYQARAWQDAPATDALARCAGSSFKVQVGSRPRPDTACLIDELTPRPIKDLPQAVKEWYQEWFTVS
jgi:hypothetical protein